MPSLRKARWESPLKSLAAPQPRQRARLALVAGAVVAASALALAGIGLWYEREEELRAAERELVNLAQTLSEQLAQRLEVIDVGLQAALRQIQESAHTPRESTESGRVLRAHAEAMISVPAIGLYGADGALVSASSETSPMLPTSLAAWGAFEALRSGQVSGLHLSLPLRNSHHGDWHLLASRSANDALGEYRGAIVAVLDPRRIAHAYAPLDLGAHTTIAVLSGESILLASHPWRDDLIARKFPDLGLGDAEGGAQVSVHKDIFDAGEILAHTTNVRGFPLRLAVMKERRAVLATWQRHVLAGGTAAVLIGGLALALAFLLDRHLRRRDESVAQLRENQAELTEAQRIARMGSWQLDGSSGRIQWSAQAAGLLDIAADDLPTFERLLQRVVEDDRPRVSSAWASLLAAGRLDVEFRARTDSGEVRWLRARAEAQPQDEAATQRVRGTLLDVTDERRAEQAAQHLAAIVESTDDAILSVANDGRIVSWNRGASRMFGYSSSDTIGRRFADLLPPEEAAEAQRLVERSIGGEIVESFETQLTAKDRRRIDIAVTLSPLRDAAGQAIAASAVARDITARRQAELRQLMEHRVAQLLAGSAPLDDTMPRILSTLCESLGMDCGAQWDLDGQGSGYRRSFLWCRPGINEDQIAAELPLVQPANGPCDVVWQTTRPQWFEHDVLVACGLAASTGPLAFASGLFIPITLGSRVVCVLELRTVRSQAHDVELLSSARAIGSQIGQYLERKRAEDDLRAEKEYIGHVIATAPTLIASIAPDGTTRSVNPTIRDLTGYLPEELHARNFWAMLHEGPPSTVAELLTEAARGGVADFHLAIRTRTGEVRDLSVSAAARRAGDGAIVEFIVVGTDVTARRLDEARRAAEYAVARALSEAQSEQQAVQSILGTICEILGWECGVFRVSDPQTRLVSCRYAWGKSNPHVAELLAVLQEPCHLGPQTMYWRTVDAGKPQWDNELPRRVGPRLGPAVKRAGVMSALSIPVGAGEASFGALQFFGQSNNRPENILLDAMQAIGHQVGQFIERKRVDAERHHANERLRSIAANIPGIVFEYRLRPNQTAAFEFVSERALDLLEEPAEALTRDPKLMFKLVEPGYRRQLLRSMHVSRHTRSLWLNEMPIRTRSGRIRWVRGQSMPKYLDDGSVVWDGVIVDVTAQKQAEHAIQQLNEQLERRVADRTAQLSAANRELESFAYSVSHDLRAPLRSIEGFSRILMEEYGPSLDATAANYLARVRNASERMGQLIDDLLSLSRVTRSELKRVRTDLSAIAEAVVQELRNEAPDRNVSVSIHPGMSCLADPSLIRIALYNLIGNAWKFTSRRPEARIEFGALTQRNRTVYYVRDNGAGFDMEHAGKLFGAFQRLHSPREFEGTGVGLATVSRIVDRHGGTVWAESVVDQGATFYFTLGTAGGRS
jgi:PAS domain S-box-containing protein